MNASRLPHRSNKFAFGRKAVLVPAVAVMLCAGSVASADDIRWTGKGNDGDWNNPDNWESYDPDNPQLDGDPVDGPPGEEDCVWIPDYDDDLGSNPTMPPIAPEHDAGDPTKNGICVGSIRIGGESPAPSGSTPDGTTITPPAPGEKLMIKAKKGVGGDVMIEGRTAICGSDGTADHPDGGGVCIDSEFGSVTNNGTVKGGNGHGTTGNGGSVDVSGRGPVSNGRGGSITGGNGRTGGGVKVGSDQDGVDNDGEIKGGDGDGGDGGDADVNGDGPVCNGARGSISGGNGDNGGGVKVGSDKDVKNDGKIKGGDADKGGGNGGGVGIDARGSIDNGEGGEIDGGKGGDGDGETGPGKGGSVTGCIETDGEIDNKGKIKGGDGGNAEEDSGKKGGKGGDVELKGKQNDEDVGTIRKGDSQGGTGGKGDPDEDANRGPNGQVYASGRAVLVAPPPPAGGGENRSVRLRSLETISLGHLVGTPLAATETIVIEAPLIDLTADRDGLILEAGVQVILSGRVVLNPGTSLDEVVAGAIILNPEWIGGVAPGTTIEPEPCGESLNGGCDDGTGITTGVWGGTIGGGIWGFGGPEADSDWYRIIGVRDTHTTDVHMASEFDALVLVFDGPTCNTGAPAIEMFVPAGGTEVASAVLSSDEVLVAVRPAGGDVSCDGRNRYTLTVGSGEPVPGCYADFDGDGSLTIFDFLAYQNAFVAGSPSADCDGDGGLTIFDFLCFQNAFVAGCP